MSIDPRGPRFAAALTAVLLALTLLTSSFWLLAIQGALFAVGAFAGPGRSPYGLLYRHLVAPRLGPPHELEPVEPVRFAQGVGLVFALAGLVGYASGLPLLGAVATGGALAAAFLNAAFGLCLGCEVYLLFRRATPRRVPVGGTPSETAA